MSMEQPQIYGLISKVMADIGAIGKDRQNEQQKYKFRGIEDMYNAAHPALVKFGVFCCPSVLEYGSEERMTKSGGAAIRVTLKMQHRFYAPDGSSVDVITLGEGIDSSDKASNKAMSAAMKYAFIELFSIPTEDVEDADKTSPDAGAKPLPVPRTAAAIPIAAKDEAQILLPDADQLITTEQAQKLHMRFREALCDALKPKAESLLHDFLGRKLYLDAHGNPSASAIRKTEYAKVGPEAMKLAKELNATEEEVRA